MDQIRLKAYAKVNLTLDVVGRRNDGYHLLESVMQSVSLADQITLSKQPAGISLKTTEPSLPTNEDNIVWQAARAFCRELPFEAGISICIEKQIPIAAGLGGGSTNAAAVLFGLNILYGGNLSIEELQKIGVKIGADVPFCLRGGTALAEGIGEKLTVLQPFPPVTFALVIPPKEVSTTAVFRQFPPSAFGSGHTRNLVKLLQANKSISELSRTLHNSLEIVTVTLVPEIEIWKRRLLDGGAQAALMSGSGPTVMGVFREYEAANRFRENWQDQNKVILAKPETTSIKHMNGGDLL